MKYRGGERSKELKKATEYIFLIPNPPTPPPSPPARARG